MATESIQLAVPFHAGGERRDNLLQDDEEGSGGEGGNGQRRWLSKARGWGVSARTGTFILLEVTPFVLILSTFGTSVQVEHSYVWGDRGGRHVTTFNRL